jgi:L-fuconolactonase
LWEEGMRALAESPSTFCKLSLSLRASELAKQVSNVTRLSDVGLVGSYTRYAVTQFGASRCCWGSDWPLSSLFAPYETVLQVARAGLQRLNAADEAAVFHGTAAQVYSA